MGLLLLSNGRQVSVPVMSVGLNSRHTDYRLPDVTVSGRCQTSNRNFTALSYSGIELVQKAENVRMADEQYNCIREQGVALLSVSRSNNRIGKTRYTKQFASS